MVAGWAPGVLTIFTSSLFQSTTITPDPVPAGPDAAAVPPPVACWNAKAAVVTASVNATPANATNDFFMFVLLLDAVGGTRPRVRWVTRRPRQCRVFCRDQICRAVTKRSAAVS